MKSTTTSPELGSQLCAGTNPLSLPSIFYWAIDSIIRLFLRALNIVLDMPPYSECIILGIDKNQPTATMAISLAALGFGRRLGVVLSLTVWVHIRRVFEHIDANRKELIKSAKVASRLHRQCVQMTSAFEESSQIKQSAPGLWKRAAENDREFRRLLIQASRIPIAQPPTLRIAQAIRSSAEHFTLLTLVVGLKGWSNPIEGEKVKQRKIMRYLVGPTIDDHVSATSIAYTNVWRLVQAAEAAAGLHPTAISTINKKYRRDYPLPSTWIDAHRKAHQPS